MATLAAGSTVSVYCPLTGTMTVTPGTSGRVSINARGRDGSQSLAPRELYTAETLSVTAGDVVSLEAINVAATYTDPAESGPAIQGLVSKAGITADDTGTAWLACPKLLSLSAVLNAGTATTVLIEVQDAALTVTTAATLTLDTISQIRRTAFLTNDAVNYRIRRSSGTGTVVVTV